MEYNPQYIAAWLNAINAHAELVKNNAPEIDQKNAENLVKSWLVRLLLSVGVDFDEAMIAAGLEDNEFANLEED